MKVKLKGTFVHNEPDGKGGVNKTTFDYRPEFYEKEDIPKGYENLYEPCTPEDLAQLAANQAKEKADAETAQIEKEHQEAVKALEVEKNTKKSNVMTKGGN